MATSERSSVVLESTRQATSFSDPEVRTRWGESTNPSGGAFCQASASEPTRRLAITIDDPTTEIGPSEAEAVNRALLDALEAHGIQAMLFVCGKRVDSPRGHALLAEWNAARHSLANHSYSHQYFHESTLTASDLVQDIER